jgi:hypothetical protein
LKLPRWFNSFQLHLRLLILVGVSVLFSNGAEALTLSEIRTQIRVHVKDVGVAGTRQTFTDAQLNALINEAQRDVINATWAIQDQTTISLVAGTTYYALPNDLIEISRVTFNNKNLKETTFAAEDAEASNAAWETTGGLPSKYFQDSTQPGYIGFKPYPNTSANTGTIKLFYIAFPSDIANDSDVPFNGVPRLYAFHDLLILYTCYKIFLIQGNQTKFQMYATQYESRIALMAGKYGSKPNYTPGFSGTRGP